MLAKNRRKGKTPPLLVGMQTNIATTEINIVIPQKKTKSSVYLKT